MLLAPWNRSRLKEYQEPEPLGKKLGDGAARKKSQELEPLKNYPAPQLLKDKSL